jgi:putative ABC transport system substrate-binding protein
LQSGFTIAAREIRTLEELDAAVASLAADGTAAFVPVASTLLQTGPAQRRLGELALRHRMPGLFLEPEAVRAGGLLSYGADLAVVWGRAAEYVDRILRGAKPGDLPIDQPSRFRLAVNLATARALGITLPPTVVARAEEVIE